MSLTFSHITLTGADDLTSPHDLLALSSKHPKIEWAILWAPRKAGSAGYPTLETIEAFAQKLPASSLALHLCEEGITDYLAQDQKIGSLAALFGRVQLNFFASRMAIAPSDIDAAAERAQNTLIVPYNPGNASIVEALRAPSIQILFDRSGGKGLLPQEWPTAIKGRLCGYAGGLGLDCIDQQLPLIARAALQGEATEVWIDLEKKLKSADGHLNINTCAQFAARVADYEKKHQPAP